MQFLENLHAGLVVVREAASGLTVGQQLVRFLQDFDASECQGSDCDIVGLFITTSLTASYEGLTDLTADSSLTVVTLVN